MQFQSLFSSHTLKQAPDLLSTGCPAPGNAENAARVGLCFSATWDTMLCWFWDTESLIYQSFYTDSLLQSLNLDNPRGSQHFYSTKLSFHISRIKAATFVRTDEAAGHCALSFLLFLHPLAGEGIKKREVLFTGVKSEEMENIISLHIGGLWHWTDLNLLTQHTVQTTQCGHCWKAAIIALQKLFPRTLICSIPS